MHRKARKFLRRCRRARTAPRLPHCHLLDRPAGLLRPEDRRPYRCVGLFGSICLGGWTAAHDSDPQQRFSWLCRHPLSPCECSAAHHMLLSWPAPRPAPQQNASRPSLWQMCASRATCQRCCCPSWGHSDLLFTLGLLSGSRCGELILQRGVLRGLWQQCSAARMPMACTPDCR